MAISDFYDKLTWKKFKDSYQKFSPGDVVKNDKGEIFLVGDINMARGTCDCCDIQGKIVETANIQELFSV